MGTFVETGEAVCPRQSAKLAVRLVGPGMVGADDALRRNDLMAVDQSRSAMTADIGEDMRLAIGVTRQDQRHSIIVMSDCLGGAGEERRGAQQMGKAVEYSPLFGLEPCFVDVDAGGKGFDPLPER